MEPVLAPGDYLVAIRRGAVRRGAIVVVERPGRPGFELVKRITGVPGDVIGGRLIEPNEYWVEGDGADRSTDSRAFGALARKEIEGMVRLRYWPLSRFTWFPNR